MSTGQILPMKLFVLRVFNNVTDQGERVFTDNTAELNSELDRGWQIDSYEMTLADPTNGVCHVLVRLSTQNGAPAVPPATPPAKPTPPPTKFFVLKPVVGSVTGRYNDLVLSKEIDRGWALQCSEVLLSDPQIFGSIILVKLINSTTSPVPATIPSS